MHGSHLSLLCHKEQARSKQRPVGSLRSKAPSRGFWMPELVLYGIRLLVPASLGKLSTNESAVMLVLDQWEVVRVEDSVWPIRAWAGCNLHFLLCSL